MKITRIGMDIAMRVLQLLGVVRHVLAALREKPQTC